MFKRANKKEKSSKSIPSIDINNAIKISEKLSTLKRGTTLSIEDEMALKTASQLIELLVTIYGVWKKSKKRISNLLKTIFGNRSEKLKDLGAPKFPEKEDIPSGVDNNDCPSTNVDNNSDKDISPNDLEIEEENSKGNNQNGDSKDREGGGGKKSADDYTAAAEITCKLDHDKMAGEICPVCKTSKLYEINPKKAIRLVGNAPITAFKFLLQQTRCICGAIFSADVGSELREVYNGEKYSPSALAAIMIFKYLTGMTFGKLEKIQKMGGIPLPATTQMNKIKIMGLPVIQAIVAICKELATNAHTLAFDDTNIRTLEKRKTKKGEPTHHGHGTAIIASGFDLEDNQIIIFDFDVNKHAGDVICELLADRKRDSLPLLVSDGLSAYDKCKANGIDVNCNVHARRKVVEEDPNRETYLGYSVLECYGSIYFNDSHCKKENYSDLERMEYHQKNSTEFFKKIKAIFEIITGTDIGEKVREKFGIPDYLTVEEPNSDIYKTAKYFLDRYGPLTQVLNIPGVPLDTNHVERVIKSIILLRKNSLFFHSHLSAKYSGDILSLLETVNLSNANVFDYMEFILTHKKKIMKNPRNFLPWIYQKSHQEKAAYWESIEQIKKCPANYLESSIVEGSHSSA